VFQRLDFDGFHREEVPTLLQERGDLAAATAGELQPIAFRLPDGRAWTYAVVVGRLDVAPGDARAAQVNETFTALRISGLSISSSAAG